ncbi:MAG TPA: hypothetical protein V6C88_09445, partial [Chroococcidiopsis sp.]
MINRRSLLVGTGLLALSQFLSACGQRAQTTLRVQFLEKSIPTQLLQQFERQLGKQTKLLFSA